jgi:DNA-binding NtrC family response regulator
MKGRLLIVDDEEMKRTALRIEAENRGYEEEEASNGIEGLERIRRYYFDVVVTDVRMPRMDGLAFLREIREISPDTTVLIMTAYGTVENAVEAMKAGARDYLLKPFGPDELFLKLDRIMEFREALALNRAFLGQVGESCSFHRMVGRSAPMHSVFRTIARVARAPATVLISGETGTGKELAAEALHHFSDRADGPLVKVSCATLARDVLESELFGHVKGAFTGALSDHRGRFELADGGTLYLDDVDDVPQELQVKLLRVLESREVERVGGSGMVPVDVRLVASTKEDLERLVEEGRFRKDLYFRLNVIQVRLPPLRERIEDVPLLARSFLNEFRSSAHHEIREIGESALQTLSSYDWPGNVRELRHAIERAVAFARTDVITPADLPEKFDQVEREAEKAVTLNLEGRSTIDLAATIREVEEGLIRWALRASDGNQARAAQLLGVPRTTLRDRLSRHGLGNEAADEPAS